MSRVRLVPIMLIAVVALAILFGGFQAYQHFNLLNPLKRDIQQVEGVQTVNISAGSPDTIQVELGPFNKLENGDLQQTYQDISNQVSSRLGTNVTVTLSDHRDAELTQALENYKLVLLEGAFKGNYVEMVNDVNSMAKRQGIHSRITMDKQYIYIQLAKGSHYLYETMPYSTHQGGATS